MKCFVRATSYSVRVCCSVTVGYSSPFIEKQPPEVFYRKAVLKDFAIFAGINLRWSLFLIKLCPQLYWKETPTQVFSCEYCEIFKSTYFEKHLRTAASAYWWLYFEKVFSHKVEKIDLIHKCKKNRFGHIYWKKLLIENFIFVKWNYYNVKV